MASLDQTEYLAYTLWGECRGEPVLGQIAVACVIRNRVQSGRWPNTYRDVVLQPRQFSCWDGDQEPEPFVTGKIFQRLMLIAEGVARLLIPDVTNGANHYINTFATPPEPDWVDPKKITLWPSPLVGVHAFMRL